MSRETTLGDSGPDRSVGENGSPTRAVFGNAADAVHEVTELAELQAKLLAADINAMKRRITLPSIVLAFVACVVLALPPVILFGVAELFIEYAELARSMAYFAAAGCGAAVALVLALIAWWGIRRGLHELDDSREELRRNLSWIKATLKRGGQRRHAARLPS